MTQRKKNATVVAVTAAPAPVVKQIVAQKRRMRARGSAPVARTTGKSSGRSYYGSTKNADFIADKLVEKKKEVAETKEAPLVYSGLPMSVISRIVTPADLVLLAQLDVLRMFIEKPSLFTYPSVSGTGSLNSDPPSPTEMAAYFAMAFVQAFYQENLLDTTVENVGNAFPKDYAVPVELAHWIKYQVRHEKGAFKCETRLKLNQDFSLTTSNISPPAQGQLQPYDLAILCTNTGQGLDHVAVYNWLYPVAGGDSSLYGYQQAYTGVYTGNTSFVGSSRMDLINNVVKKNFNYVAFSEISHNAPDASAWGVPIGVEGVTPTNWSQFAAIMNNTGEFDPQMTVVCRPNIAADVNQLQLAGSFLGAVDCVPMGTQLICQPSNGIPVVANVNVCVQYLQQFLWIASKNKYFHGKCFNSSNSAGFKLTWDGIQYYVPDMCRWVSRTVDYSLILRRALQGLIEFINSGIQLQAPTSDLLANFICCVDSLIYNRVAKLGNCLWTTGNGPSASFMPQSLVPNDCSSLRLPLFLKAILDQIGPSYSQGVLIYPSCYLNCGATQLTDLNQNLWSKYGLIPNAAGNRFIGPISNLNFQSGDFYLTMNNIFFGANTTVGATFTPYIGAGGLDDSTTSLGASVQLYKAAYAGFSATAIQANMNALAPLNGQSPQSVFWFAGISNMWDGVSGYLKLNNINNRNVGGVQHFGLGGPGMLSTITYSNQQNLGAGMGGSTCKMYDTTNGFAAAVLIEPNVNVVYEAWAQRRLSSVAPLSIRDTTLTQAFGPCSYYYKFGALPPVDVRTPVFVSGLTAVTGIQVAKAFFGELISTDSGLIIGYVKNESSQHSVKDMSNALAPQTKKTEDCLRLPLTSAADSISQAMTTINSWTSIVPVPAVARSIWNLSSKVLHHYSVAGTKVNAYFKEKRRNTKAKQQVSELRKLQELVD
jgi:hypothetical protein